jgi:RpiB/LacA/LacB family sugar-phosphate isomerase
MKIAIGSDHRGFALKAHLVPMLERAGHEIMDVGCRNAEACDYPDFGIAVGEAVASGAVDRGIAVCGSGIGMSIVVNKVRGIRAALCRTVDDARMTRRHNDSNVLVLSERALEDPALSEIVKIWLETPFDGGRHQRRIDRIREYEARNMKRLGC